MFVVYQKRLDKLPLNPGSTTAVSNPGRTVMVAISQRLTARVASVILRKRRRL